MSPRLLCTNPFFNTSPLIAQAFLIPSSFHNANTQFLSNVNQHILPQAKEETALCGLQLSCRNFLVVKAAATRTCIL